MARVVIFGVQDFAELATYYLENDSEHTVVAYAVHQSYVPDSKTFQGRPVVPFETVEEIYPPEAFSFFAPLSHARMNRFRTEVYEAAKKKGYTLISYVSSRATRMGNKVGENCFILEDNTLQPFTEIGNNVVLWSGNHIGHHGKIMDHVFFTSHVVMSGHCTVEPLSFCGVNATLRDGITLKEGTMVAMGALVTQSTEPWGIYMGVPAKKRPGSSRELD